MVKKIPFLVLILTNLNASDWELLVPADNTPLTAFLLRLTKEVLTTAGDSFRMIPDAEEGHQDIRWVYPGVNDAEDGWEMVHSNLTSGFGGLVTIRAPESDLETWQQVKSLSDVRRLSREALLRSDSPWVAIWKKSLLPFRFDNTNSPGLAPGTYRVVSLAELSMESDQSLLPPPKAPVFFQTSTDLALQIRTTWNRRDKDRFKDAFQRGWLELNQSGRLAFLIRSYFLPAFQEFGLRERITISIP